MTKREESSLVTLVIVGFNRFNIGGFGFSQRENKPRGRRGRCRGVEGIWCERCVKLLVLLTRVLLVELFKVPI